MTREEDPFCGKKFFSFFFVKESPLSNSTWSCSIGGKIQIFKTCFIFTGTQYMVSLQFSGRRIISPTVQTYGQIKLMLEDKNGINETFSLTQ